MSSILLGGITMIIRILCDGRVKVTDRKLMRKETKKQIKKLRNVRHLCHSEVLDEEIQALENRTRP